MQSGITLLNMWSVDVEPQVRKFIRHFHTRFEITVINSGLGEYTTERKTYPIKAGDVFVFSANEVHSITKVGKERLSLTNLHFEPRYLIEKDEDDLCRSFINFCFSHSVEFENRIPSEKAAVIRENHFNIKNELLNRQEGYETAIKSYLNLILIDLLRNHKYQNSALSEDQQSIFDILAVYDYINQHLSENIRLKDMADIACLSQNYFSAVFKELNGLSPTEYVISKRIEMATRLLLNNPNMTVLEIAVRCGFNNTVNFNKAFKKQIGLTPSQYRKHKDVIIH